MVRNKNDLPQRGALLVTLKPSTPTLTAGSSFSISVTITNPYNVPVTIQEVSTLLPVDLFDVNASARLREQRKAKEELEAYRYNLLNQFGASNIKKVRVKDEGTLHYLLRFVVNMILPGLIRIPREFVDDLVDTYASAVATVAGKTGQTGVLLASMLEPAQYEIQSGLSSEEIQQKVDSIMTGLEQKYKKSLDEE